MQPKRSPSIRNVSVQTRQTTSPFAYTNDNEKNGGIDYTGKQSDIASQFNTEYEKQGLQPSVGTRPNPQGPNQVKVSYNQKSLPSTPTTNSNDRTGRREDSSSSKKGKLLTANHREATVVDAAKIAKLRNVVKLRKFLKGNIAATRVNITTLYVAGPLWFTLQLPLALLSIVFLGFGSVTEDVVRGLGIFQIIMNMVIPAQFITLNVIPSIIEYATGYSISAGDLWQNTNLALYTLFSTGAFLIGLITMLGMAIYYTISGVNCLFGEHSGAKMIAFIVAMFFYLVPVLNLFPWFILWGVVVWRYPK